MNKSDLKNVALAVGGTYVDAKTPKKLNLSSKDNKKLGDGTTLTFEPEVDGFNDQYTLVRLSDGTKTLNANLTQNSLDLVDFDYGLNKNHEDLTAYASPRIPQNVRTKEQLANWCLIHMRRHFLRFAKTKTKATQAALHVKVNKGNRAYGFGFNVRSDDASVRKLLNALKKLATTYKHGVD